MTNIKSYLSLIGLLLVFAACDDNDPSPTQELSDILGDNHLELGTFLGTISSQEIANIARQFGGTFTGNSSQDVNAYRVEYPTTYYDGTPLTASGLVLFPSNTENMPTISYQHGTIIQQREAPSFFDRGNTVVNYLLVMASYGYIVTAPDYLGYGASQEVAHPFEHRATMGSSCFDMLMASRELAAKIELSTSDGLFLAGYSQGGYATMAMHRHLTENSSLEVTMSAPGAGAYNKSGTVSALETQQIIIDNPGAWLWNIHVINQTSGVNRPWEEIITADDAAIVAAVDDPMLWPTRTDFDRNPRELFTESFIDGLSDGSDEELLEAFRDNDTHSWSAVDPITLYYGTDDTSVFPFHAETAFNELTRLGAPVAIVPFEGLDHQEAVLPYWQAILQQFESLR